MSQDKEWEALKIVKEDAQRYKIAWKGIDPDTREKWKPTWEPKANANATLIRAWEEHKRQRAADRAAEAAASKKVKLEQLSNSPVPGPSRHFSKAPSVAPARETRSSSRSSKSVEPPPTALPTLRKRKRPTAAVDGNGSNPKRRRSTPPLEAEEAPAHSPSAEDPVVRDPSSPPVEAPRRKGRPTVIDIEDDDEVMQDGDPAQPKATEEAGEKTQSSKSSGSVVPDSQPFADRAEPSTSSGERAKEIDEMPPPPAILRAADGRPLRPVPIPGPAAFQRAVSPEASSQPAPPGSNHTSPIQSVYSQSLASSAETRPPVPIARAPPPAVVPNGSAWAKSQPFGAGPRPLIEVVGSTAVEPEEEDDRPAQTPLSPNTIKQILQPPSSSSREKASEKARTFGEVGRGDLTDAVFEQAGADDTVDQEEDSAPEAPRMSQGARSRSGMSSNTSSREEEEESSGSSALLEELTTKLNEAIASKRQLRIQLDTTSAYLAAVRNEHVATQSALSQAQAAVTLEMAQREKAAMRAEAMRRRAEGAERELVEATRRETTLQSERAQGTTELERLKAYVVKLQQQVTQLSASLATAEADRQTMETERTTQTKAFYDQYRAHITALEAERSAHAEAKAQLSLAEQTVDKTKQTLQASMQAADIQAQLRVAEITASFDAAIARAATAEAARDDLAGQLTTARLNGDAAREAYQGARQHADEVEVARHTVLRANIELSNQNERLRQQLTRGVQQQAMHAGAALTKLRYESARDLKRMSLERDAAVLARRKLEQVVVKTEEFDKSIHFDAYDHDEDSDEDETYSGAILLSPPLSSSDDGDDERLAIPTSFAAAAEESEEDDGVFQCEWRLADGRCGVLLEDKLELLQHVLFTHLS